MIIDKPIVFTRHFTERMTLYRMPYWKLFQYIPQAVEEKKPLNNNTKYTNNEGVKSLRYGTYIMTYKETKDKDGGYPIYLFFTLFDQRVYLPTPEVI